jgi:hypothetical protein
MFGSEEFASKYGKLHLMFKIISIF